MESPEALIGQHLGQYRVDQHLARSNMADVYLATNMDLERQDVLKVLLPFFSHDPVFVERFRSEAKTMAKLHHPNLVQVYASGITPDQRPYIVIQYIRGGNLDDKLIELGRQGQVLTAAMALAITRQVASALSVAHNEDIVHRDLKPSNVLLDTDLKPYITDFGIAITVNGPRLTQSNILMGTPEYMSPEQAGQEHLDGRSDIYSLGIVLYQMLAGRLPFVADSPWTIIHKQINEKEVPVNKIRSDISSATNAIVAKCLQKKPEKRFQTAEELVAALDNALRLEGIVVPVTKSGVWARPVVITGAIAKGLAGVVKNGKTWWARPVIAAVAVLILGTGAWMVVGDRDQTTPAPSPVTETVELIVVVDKTKTATPRSPAPTSTRLRPTSTLASVVEMAESTATSTRTPTPRPANTRTPTPTAQAPAPMTSTPTSAMLIGSSARVQAKSPVFLFSGPGGRDDYRIVGTLKVGETVDALYQSRGNNFYVVRLPSGHLAWVNKDSVNVLDGPVILPTVATVPPVEVTPTRPPTSTPDATETPEVPTGGQGNGNGGGTKNPTPALPDEDPDDSDDPRPTPQPTPKAAAIHQSINGVDSKIFQ